KYPVHAELQARSAKREAAAPVKTNQTLPGRAFLLDEFPQPRLRRSSAPGCLPDRSVATTLSVRRSEFRPVHCRIAGSLAAPPPALDGVLERMAFAVATGLWSKNRHT